MDSSASAWDFNAPTFVDFSQQEHEKKDDVESYFDVVHETSQDNSGYSDTFLQKNNLKSDAFVEPNNNLCEGVKTGRSDKQPENDSTRSHGDRESRTETSDSLPEDPDSLDEEQNPEILKNPDVKQDACAEMNVNLEDESDMSEIVAKDRQEMEVTPTSSRKQSSKEVVEAVSSNIITPSRVASWNRAPRQVNNNVPPKTSSANRSNQLKKVKDLRRSARLFSPSSATALTDGPPNKKKKSNKGPKVKLVQPVTPTVLKHKRHTSVHKQVKSSEQLELEVIENLKHKAKQISKESSKSYKVAMNPSTSTELKAPSKRTIPKEFKFKTDERVRQDHAMITRSRTVSAEMSFIQGLRDHPPSPGKPKCTVVKPFNFASDRKRKLEMSKATNKGYDFVPMANAVMNFTKKSIRSNKSVTNKGPLKAVPTLTMAKTPKLESRTRTRQVSVVSAQELEDREVEEMKSYQFKAKPVNRDILDHADPLPGVEKMKATKPVEFHLEIDKRFENDKQEEKADPTPNKPFKARPVPKKILEHVVGVPLADPAEPTVPQSPAFKLRNRMEVAQKNKENMKEMLKVKLCNR